MIELVDIVGPIGGIRAEAVSGDRQVVNRRRLKRLS